MATLKHEKTTVILTEQTLKELNKAVEEAKKKATEKDADEASIVASVDSYYSKVDFHIGLEIKPHSMESMGFRLKDVIKRYHPPIDKNLTVCACDYEEKVESLMDN
jgi:hypothetical protein